MAFGIGAVAGAVGAATGGAAFAAFGGAAAGAGGFLAGAGGAMMATAFSSPVENIGNAIYFNDPLMTPKQYLVGVGTSALLGGTINGCAALYQGKSFFTGKTISSKTFTIPQKPSFEIDTPESELNTDGLRMEIKEALPDNQPARYAETYYKKVSGIDKHHTWNRQSIEIVVDNGKIFPIPSKDGKGGALLIQQLGSHNGEDGVFELIIRNG